MVTTRKPLTIVAVGDVFVDRNKPDEPFSEVIDLLKAGDVVFGNLEGSYNAAAALRRYSGFGLVSHSRQLSAFKRAGFNVLSCANNHIVDGGEDELVKMLQRLGTLGVATAGAGKNLDEARRPAMLRRKGWRVATLAYSSIFPYGFEAHATKPGLAPLRAHSVYVEYPNDYWMPGSLPEVHTIPVEADDAAFRADLAAARKTSDLLIVSIHWGDHTRPGVLTDHERRTARTAIDGGADIVLGHHHHLLRGIEIYRGKPIFFGLGHFVFDIRNWDARITEAGVADQKRRYGEYGLYERPGYPLLPFHPEGRYTVIARCRVTASGRIRSDLVPCVIDPTGRVVPLDPRTGEGLVVADYTRHLQTVAELNARLDVDEKPSWGGLPTLAVRDT